MILRRLFDGIVNERLSGVITSTGEVTSPAEEAVVRFRLYPWRAGGRAPELRPLWVRADVSALPGDWRKELSEGRAVALEIARGSWQWPQGAKLVRVLGDAAEDEPLREAAARLRSAAIDDTRFGRLGYDPAHGWYEGKARWGDSEVEILLMNDGGAAQQALAAAHRLWDEMELVDPELQRRIVAELLPLKSESWLEENEAPLSDADFLSRIALEAVHVHGDGLTEFYYDDGDLFSGHTIIAAREGDGEISDVQIAG
jgi:hypothetical protein